MLEINKQFQDMKYEYDILKGDEKKIVNKLNTHLSFYSFRPFQKSKKVEVFYDTETNMLSSAGIVLSKVIRDKDCFIQISTINYISSNANKASKKVRISDCQPKQTPRDFSFQIATAINNMYENIFTIDLTEVLKKVSPFIQVKTDENIYQIFGGTGYKATISFERTTYKDLKHGKKVKRDGATLRTVLDPNYEKERQDLLYGIERYCKELFPYTESKFEIAKRVLRSKKELKEVEAIRRAEEEKRKKEEQEQG